MCVFGIKACPEDISHPPCHLALQGSFFDLLDEEVPLVLRCPPILGSDNASWPVQVEHVDQVLLLVFQLLNLSLQFSIDGFQLFGFLVTEEACEDKLEVLNMSPLGGGQAHIIYFLPINSFL